MEQMQCLPKEGNQKNRMFFLQRLWTKLFVSGVVLVGIVAWGIPSAFAVQGTPLPGQKIPQFVDPLPNLDLTMSGTAGLDTLLAGTGEIKLHMKTFLANIMPSTFVPANGLPYAGTWTFGYVDATSGQQAGLRESPVGPVIVAARGVPTQIRYINDLEASDPALPANDPASNIHWRDWTDQTLHSAFHQAANDPMPIPADANNHYMGPVLAVPHLHGAEDPAVIDGGPEAWFTSSVLGPNGTDIPIKQGPAYYTMLENPPTPLNEAVYRYPNTQQAAPLWFHDHLLGGTRLNATFAGLAGAYLLTDPALNLPAGLSRAGLTNTGNSLDLNRLLTPLVIQDRMFDTNGQLYFPNVGVNPEHPFWVPEFAGDVMVVNGKVWPYMSVDRQRYRFFLINGSNSRPYDMWLQDLTTGIKGPPMYVIATDGGYLDTPVKIDPNANGQAKKAGVQKTLFMMPGERYEIIVDFNDPAWVASVGPNPVNLVLRNKAPTVYGNPKAKTEGRIMQFRVSATVPLDTSYNPAAVPIVPIRSGGQIIDRLPGTPGGPLINATTVQKTRRLTLNEVPGPGGPLEALVNNSKWGGKRPDGSAIVDSVPINGNNLTEFPNEGDVEVWEIANLTADSHPIHLHAIQFQLIDRQPFDAAAYTAVYDGSFTNDVGAIDPLTGLAYPNGVFIPGYGPPLPYNTPIAGAVGGNPDIAPFLLGVPAPPLAHETGWKDTIIMHPGERTRIAARWTPQEGGFFAYDPDATIGFGPNANEPGVYVWHCHITDHEDNEMMRPDVLKSSSAAPARTYIQGTDF